MKKYFVLIGFVLVILISGCIQETKQNLGESQDFERISYSSICGGCFGGGAIESVTIWGDGKVVGFVDGERFDFALTQSELSEFRRMVSGILDLEEEYGDPECHNHDAVSFRLVIGFDGEEKHIVGCYGEGPKKLNEFLGKISGLEEI